MSGPQKLKHAAIIYGWSSKTFQLYHGENKLIFNEMMIMMSTLYKTNMLSWIFLVLTHWNNSPRVDMSLHSDTLSWFRANQYLLFLLNAACLAEKQQLPIYNLWFDTTGARTHDLPHSRRSRWPLRPRCGSLAKRESTKGQIIVHKILREKLKISSTSTRNNQEWTQIFRMSMQSLIYYYHSSCDSRWW